MITVQEFNQEFGNSEIRFYTDSHGLACAELNNPMGKAEIALHGAHLMSFIPKGQEDMFDDMISHSTLQKELLDDLLNNKINKEGDNDGDTNSSDFFEEDDENPYL